MTVFATGCTHFGHENIIRLAKRPFMSVEEMNEKLIENWNATVTSRDVVYHLGDFAWNKSHGIKHRLNGTIICLQGNHDPDHWGEAYSEIKIAGTKVVMFHYPIEEWNGFYRGSVHLHCHTHKPEMFNGERRFNVGVDATDFRPIAIEHLLT